MFNIVVLGTAAAAAASLARDAEAGELLLTHLSGCDKTWEILAETARLPLRAWVAADFDRISVGDPAAASVLEHPRP